MFLQEKARSTVGPGLSVIPTAKVHRKNENSKQSLEFNSYLTQKPCLRHYNVNRVGYDGSVKIFQLFSTKNTSV